MSHGRGFLKWTLWLMPLMVACGGRASAPGPGDAGSGVDVAGGGTAGVQGEADAGESGSQDADLPCGAEGEVCCTGSTCNAGLECTASGGVSTCSLLPKSTGTPCVNDASCGSGAACVDVGGGRSVCTTSCTSTADCVAGWTCAPLPLHGSGVCQCTATAELCDGKDDDCNGVVDDEPEADGACAQKLGPGHVCTSGACACGAMCDGTCVDPHTDLHNCGGCGKQCPTGAACDQGQCHCPAGQDVCSGQCMDLQTTRDNCGACGHSCTVGCYAGQCVQVTAIAAATYAILSSGQVQRLGASAPVQGLADVIAIALAERATCAVVADGTVYCWGSNESGQLGDGTTTTRTSPAPVVGVSGAIGVAVGGSSLEHACAVLSDGTVMCWGSDYLGALGIIVGSGTYSYSATPTKVPGVTDAKQIVVGDGYSCALLSDGSVDCWGANSKGQLGDGTTTSRSAAAPVPGLTGVSAISATWAHTCVLLSDSSVECWGDNLMGDLGLGTTSGTRDVRHGCAEPVRGHRHRNRRREYLRAAVEWFRRVLGLERIGPTGHREQHGTGNLWIQRVRILADPCPEPIGRDRSQLRRLANVRDGLGDA